VNFREIFGGASVFIGIFLAAVMYLSFLQSESERNLGLSELDMLNRFLSTFLEHDRTAYDFTEGNFSSITSNIGTSIDPFTECVLFYRDLQNESDDSYGVCGFHRAIHVEKMGWDLREGKIILAKPVGQKGAVVLFRNNPRELVWENGDFHMPVRLRHVKTVFAAALLIALLASTFLILLLKHRLELREKEYLTREKAFLKKEYDAKSRQLHDATSLATGMAIWGHRIKDASSDPGVGDLLIAASDVAALCTAPEKPMKIPTNTREFSQTLLKGYFFSTGEEPVESVDTGEICNLTLMVSQTDLMRALKNLLENADKCRTTGKIFYSVQKVSEGVQFSIKNAGHIKQPEKIFEEGFSGRGSSGKGMAIVQKAMQNLNSTLNISQESGYVTFSFVVGI